MLDNWGLQFSTQICPTGVLKPDLPANADWNSRARRTQEFTGCWSR
jgi:hypothetical protein